jgi:hypothetical protein
MFVDFPLVITLGKRLPPFWVFTIFGTLCWYGVSLAFRFLYTKLVLEK